MLWLITKSAYVIYEWSPRRLCWRPLDMRSNRQGRGPRVLLGTDFVIQMSSQIFFLTRETDTKMTRAKS
jgi:hypothetical protein